jgi:phosphate transport system protein
MSHLEARLEKDLKQIRSLVDEQAKRVEESVRNAVHALQTANRNLAYATILADHPINRRMRQTDRLCHSFIAVHLPSAGHLRLMSSVIRVNIELERIGDYAVTISREAVQLSGRPNGTMARELERMSGETLLMLRQSLKAFADLNAEMARSTMAIAEQIESDMDLIYGELMANKAQPAIKDLLGIFVVFNQLKRVADQAKNICEETVFAVTGHQKEPKVYNVLFVDEDNSCLSPMAEAIASNQYPESGRYRSAGRSPAEQLNATLVEFLGKRGIDLGDKQPSTLDLTHRELADQHVIVSLQGPVLSYVSPVPFHTTALEWELGPAPEAGDEQRVEELYREIAVQIKDLMELLRGEGAS